MDVTFGALDAFAFVVFAVLIVAGVAIVVGLGKLPGQLARKWGHPYASAVNAASWIGIATGGLLWPLAFIWAFTALSKPTSSIVEARQARGTEPMLAASAGPAPSALAGQESRP
jgi:hypothetical protein